MHMQYQSEIESAAQEGGDAAFSNASQSCFDKAMAAGDAGDMAKCAEWLRRGAANGEDYAKHVFSAAASDHSGERLFVECKVCDWLRMQDACFDDAYFDLAPVAPDNDTSWLAAGRPEGTVIPPPSGRDNVRTPNMTSANPSFAAMLAIFVRDRFGGDAPGVYRAAHVSRKTYSAIVSNELRTVSKNTAISFALALNLSRDEAGKLLAAAGFALSGFLLEDIIVDACIKAGIFDIDRVNSILAAHSASTLC